MLWNLTAVHDYRCKHFWEPQSKCCAVRRHTDVVLLSGIDSIGLVWHLHTKLSFHCCAGSFLHSGCIQIHGESNCINYASPNLNRTALQCVSPGGIKIVVVSRNEFRYTKLFSISSTLYCVEYHWCSHASHPVHAGMDSTPPAPENEQMGKEN